MFKGLKKKYDREKKRNKKKNKKNTSKEFSNRLTLKSFHNRFKIDSQCTSISVLSVFSKSKIPFIRRKYCIEQAVRMNM